MLSTNIVLDTDHLNSVVKYFLKYDAFAYDIETAGVYRRVAAHNPVTWISLATHGMAVAIPMGHERGDKIVGYKTEPRETKTGKIINRKVPVWEPAPSQLRPSQVFAALEPLLFSDRLKICHNAPFDLASVVKYYDGRRIPKPWRDTYIESVLLNENRLNGLKPRVRELYGIEYDKEEVGRCVESHPFSKVARYALMDARYTWLLAKRMDGLIEKEGLSGIFTLEMDTIEATVEMLLRGAPVSRKVLEDFGRELKERLVRIAADIYRLADRKIDLNSSQQKARMLWGSKRDGGLGLKPVNLTEGGKAKQRAGKPLSAIDYSTDVKSLDPYKDHPVVAKLLEYQQNEKLRSTYVDGILGVEGKADKPCLIIDGRVHASFNQVGARTGRWSSSAPNAQNIPTRTEDGRIIRSAYKALADHKLIVADYGQIELVMLAHFIGHGALYDGFHAGVDAHTTTASLVFGVDPENVDKQMRSVAKGISFAIVYGAGPSKVADMAGISLDEAKKHMQTHQRMFPEIYKYRAFVIDNACKKRPPHIRTILGRKRRIPELLSRDEEKRASAERRIFNAKIQGSAADLIKLAMVRLMALKPERAELILTVHDELVAHVPEDLVEDMTGVMRLRSLQG